MVAEYSEVTERFLRYVQVDTQSEEDSKDFPSTQKQKNLAGILAQGLEKMGASDVYFDQKFGYVYAVIPETTQVKSESHPEMQIEPRPVLGFIAHMDTSPEVSGADVRPQIVHGYDGRDILLGELDGKKMILSPKEFPELKDYIGRDLITTDGTTLLGADDKAGVAEIMTMASYLLSHPDVKHHRIAIAFTPDEEVGAGVDHFDLKRFGADYAYTVDGGAIGELEYENFNAASAVIDVRGRSVHPGEAKHKMKNAALMAMEFEHLLPIQEKPALTEGYEGFYHLSRMEGTVESARLEYIIRDHDRQKFEEKKAHMEYLCDELNQKYGDSCFTPQIKDQYYNMAEKMESNMFLVDEAKECMEKLDITPKIQPIRGGTDGARLSYMGLPCPNLCAGGHNFHGRYEYCCIQSMEKISELLVLLAGYSAS
jgi:tripeptide aminopeptidase